MLENDFKNLDAYLEMASRGDFKDLSIIACVFFKDGKFLGHSEDREVFLGNLDSEEREEIFTVAPNRVYRIGGPRRVSPENQIED